MIREVSHSILMTRKLIYLLRSETEIRLTEMDSLGMTALGKHSIGVRHLSLVSLKHSQILQHGSFSWSCLVLSNTVLDINTNAFISSQIPTATKRECLLYFHYKVRCKLEFTYSIVLRNLSCCMETNNIILLPTKLGNF